MVGLSQQGAWTRWKDVEKKRITWSNCWRPDFSEIRLLIKSVYDVLSSPTNLHIWGKREKLKQINFVKAGEKIQRKRREKTNLLSSADDWQLIVDLETQLKFPRHIAVTSLRLDLILHSDNTKQCIIWELTVSWEEYITLAERKRSKYQELVEQCQQKSWKIHYDPVEVGCRGFAGQSLGRALAKIGIVRAARVRALKDITNTVLKASKWIWLKRSEPWKK